MGDSRIYLQDANGELTSAGILYNPEIEELRVVKIKEELTPKQKFMMNKNIQSKEKLFFESELGGFINMYYVKNDILFNDLNLETANISRIIYLATYIDWNSGQENLLVKPGQFNVAHPMTRRDMQILLGLAERTFISFLNNTKSSNLLYEVEGKYYLNSDYFNKGKVPFENKKYTRLYINTIRDLFAQCNPRRHRTLSHLFKLIPKTYHMNNAIVHNPDEQDSNKISNMNLLDICNFLNIGKDNTTKLKRELISFYVCYDGKKVSAFKYITTEGVNGKSNYFVLNPQISYSGDNFELASEISKLCYFNDEK